MGRLRGGSPTRGVEEAAAAVGATRRIEKPRFERGAHMATAVEAQIAGSLWKIEKAVGDAVEADDVIMIIESMKMEIPVEAPCAGTIGEIRVQEGEAIEEGAVLALIE
jgi:biotin carboxyl carrier protein